MCLDRLDFLEKFWSQWLHCSGKRECQVIWCICWVFSVSLQCGCLTSCWWKKPWSRSSRGRRQVTKGTKGNLTTTKLRCIFSSFLLFPSISFWSSSSSFFSIPSSSFHSSFRRFWMPPGPPSSPAGPIGQALGCLIASSSTRFKNNDRLEIINKNSDRYHKTLISYLCHLDRTWRKKN